MSIESAPGLGTAVTVTLPAGRRSGNRKNTGEAGIGAGKQGETQDAEEKA